MIQCGEEVDRVAKLVQQVLVVLGKIVFVDIMVGSGARDRDVLSLKSFLLCFWLTPVGRLAWCYLLFFRWTLVINVNDGRWMSTKA